MQTHVIFYILMASVSFILVRSLPQDYMMPLPNGCTCPIVDAEDDPVCGNNGQTYPNLFALRCADSCVPYNIHFMHHGPCISDGDRWRAMSSIRSRTQHQKST